MFSHVLLSTLAAGSLFTLSSGAPLPAFFRGLVTKTRSAHSLQARSATYITTFGGTGEPTDGWPAMSDWVSSFETMFENNKAVMSSGCGQFGVAENSDDEMNDISSAIQSVGASTGVDPRFILAIVMQESNGCVRAPTTNYGVTNPGLMQSHDGSGSCNEGSVMNPCPQSEITQMITDGTAGTSSGDGLKQCLAQAGASDVSQYYKAARIYNSGSIDASKNLGAGIATHCYASDIANRLIGWSSGPSTCLAADVVSLTTSNYKSSGSSSSSDSSPAAAPAASSSTSTSAAPAATSAAAAVSVPGGAFAQLPTTTLSATPVVTSAAAAGVESAAPAAVSPPTSTVSVIPIAATPSPAAASPPSPASSASSSAPTAASPSPSPSTSSSGNTTTGVITPGSACSSEGTWNCVGTSAFQQCGSGTWSVVQQLAAGTQCVTGQSSAISISAIEDI